MPKIKHRLPTLKKLLKRLEKISHKYVRDRGKNRTGGKCERCIMNDGYSANHILPAGDYPGVRYDCENMFYGCVECNYRERWHRIPEAQYWRKRLGSEKYDSMAEKGRQITKYSRDQVIEMIESYRRAKGYDIPT